MNRQQKRASERSVKALIAEKTKDFEKRLFEARNDYELFKVLQECRGVSNAEINHWTKLYLTEEELGNKADENYLKAIAAEVSPLQELDEKFKTAQTECLEKAKTLQQALKNSHKINKDEPTLEVKDYTTDAPDIEETTGEIE